MRREVVGRTVTLVVSTADEVLGALDPFDVETPWWQDLEPVSRRHNELAVLRLLGVRGGSMSSGGHVTYLAEPRFGAAVSTELRGALRSWDGALDDDERRMPWARSRGPSDDVAWACDRTPGATELLQHRSWNLSAIWSLRSPTTTTWLKCVPWFYEHEASILELLSDQAVPRLVDAERHRLLLEEMAGCDGYDASLDERRELIDALVGLQLATADRTGELLARGVPDRRWPAFLDDATQVVHRRAPTSEPLAGLLETSGQRIAAIDACGLPAVLVHGDAHPGNARIRTGSAVGTWFDWGDATVGHPLLDVAVLDRPGTSHRDELVAHWLDAWRRAVPSSDPDRAWRLVRPLAALVGAVVYQRFLDRIEPSERIYHEGDVEPALAFAASVAESSSLGR
jgi:hypothetical protein